MYREDKLNIIEQQKEPVPTFISNGQDYRAEWGRLFSGTEEEFPTEASFANHFFNWPHVIDGDRREQFDCTKENSFVLIPPQTYLAAYRKAKERGEI
jgi:hypothetical protein